VEEDGDFLEVARYIVLNPVRAGIVDGCARAQRLYTAFVEAGIGADRPGSIGDINNGSAAFACGHAPKRRILEVHDDSWIPSHQVSMLCSPSGLAMKHQRKS
jgi:hypothetical protein